MFVNCMSIQAPNEICRIDFDLNAITWFGGERVEPAYLGQKLDHLVCLNGPGAAKDVPNCPDQLDTPQRRTALTNLDAAARILLVHRREQDQSSGLSAEAAELRCRTRSIR